MSHASAAATKAKHSTAHPKTSEGKRDTHQAAVALMRPATKRHHILCCCVSCLARFCRITTWTSAHGRCRSITFQHKSWNGQPDMHTFTTTRHANGSHNAAQRSLCTAEEDSLVSITSSCKRRARRQQVTSGARMASASAAAPALPMLFFPRYSSVMVPFTL